MNSLDDFNLPAEHWWLYTSYHAYQIGDVIQSLDIIYAELQRHLGTDHFIYVNEFLALDELITMPLRMLLAVIAVTRPYRSDLPARGVLCQMIRDLWRGTEKLSLLDVNDV